MKTIITAALIALVALCGLGTLSGCTIINTSPTYRAGGAVNTGDEPECNKLVKQDDGRLLCVHEPPPPAKPDHRGRRIPLQRVAAGCEASEADVSRMPTPRGPVTTIRYVA